jgi:hypothetical protein
LQWFFFFFAKAAMQAAIIRQKLNAEAKGIIQIN